MCFTSSYKIVSGVASSSFIIIIIVIISMGIILLLLFLVDHATAWKSVSPQEEATRKKKWAWKRWKLQIARDCWPHLACVCSWLLARTLQSLQCCRRNMTTHSCCWPTNDNWEIICLFVGITEPVYVIASGMKFFFISSLKHLLLFFITALLCCAAAMLG